MDVLQKQFLKCLGLRRVEDDRRCSRVRNGRVSLLFHQDPRLTDLFPDVWVLGPELEGSPRVMLHLD